MQRTTLSRNGWIVVVVCAVGTINAFLFSIPIMVGEQPHNHSIGESYLGNSGVLFQKRPNGCGLTALRMIFQHFGAEISEQEMERQAEVSGSGYSMLTLKKVAESKGFRASGWRLTQYDLKDSPFPLILFVRQNHFVVADSVSSHHVYIRDPAVGRIRISLKELSRIWSGEALLIEAQSTKK